MVVFPVNLMLGSRRPASRRPASRPYPAAAPLPKPKIYSYFFKIQTHSHHYQHLAYIFDFILAKDFEERQHGLRISQV